MIKFERMTEEHSDAVVGMMRTFYSSDAVHTSGSEEIFKNDVDACIGDNPYLEGYVITAGGELCGYAMVAKSFSTEFGRQCLWIEDLYLLPQCRGKGAATAFFSYISEKYPGSILRLEADGDNDAALSVYRKCGFDVMDYTEMKKIVP